MLLFPSLRAHRKQANRSPERYHRSAISLTQSQSYLPSTLEDRNSPIFNTPGFLHFSLSLHFTCNLQSANCKLQSAFCTDPSFLFFFLTNIATDLAYIDWSNCVNTQTNCFWENWSANYWRDFLHDHGCRPTSVWQSGQRNFLCLWLANLCKHSKQKVWRQAMV